LESLVESISCGFLGKIKGRALDSILHLLTKRIVKLLSLRKRL